MKTVLITGCSSGFGRDLVTRFLARGWTVLAGLRGTARQSADQRGREIFEVELKQYPRNLILLPLEVTLPQDRAVAAARIRDEFQGRLDCLVNNAGYGAFGALEDSTEEQIRIQFEVNFFGLALLTRDLLPFVRASRGKIINLSSALGFVGLPLTSLYCASKFAVEGFSESLRHELAPHGVRVSIVEPGGFDTGFNPKSTWGALSFGAGSAYQRQSEGYRRLREGRGLPGGEAVVQAILRLAERSGGLPLRVRVGMDSRLSYFLKRILPDRVFQALSTRFWNRLNR